MRLDLHIHSTFSSDGTATPEGIVEQAKKAGLDGIAIVDHNSPEGGKRAAALGKEVGVLVVPGLEVSSIDGHILALGVTGLIKRGLPAQETVEIIHKEGGIAIAPHPYRFWSGLGEGTVRGARFDAIEGVNARSVLSQNQLAQRLASDLGLGTTGGSDSHTLESIGEAVTVLETGDAGVDTVLEAVRKCKTRGEGRSRGHAETVGYVYKSVTQWLGRGMRKM